MKDAHLQGKCPLHWIRRDEIGFHIRCTITNDTCPQEYGQIVKCEHYQRILAAGWGPRLTEDTLWSVFTKAYQDATGLHLYDHQTKHIIRAITEAQDE